MSDSFQFDLNAYCRRIGFVGRLEPTLPVLKSLAERHACSIPFENLDVVLGRGVDLNPEALEKKLVHDRRGGYCFEQNSLMLGVLRQIGFEVTPLAGRVRLGRTREELPPRTHLFLSVKIEGEEWLFDVGVGGFSLTTPIRRNSNEEQLTLHEPRRILGSEGAYFHQGWSGKEWIDVYEFSGEEMPEIDREVSNWWTSTSPKSKFSQNLFCALASSNGERLGLINDRFTRRRGDDVLEVIEIGSADQLLEILDLRFGLGFSVGTRFQSGDRPWPTT